MPDASELKALTPYKRPGALKVDSDGVWWECTMEPFDVVAGVLTRDDVTFGQTYHELPEEVATNMRAEIAELSKRISALANPREISLGENSSFEVADGESKEVLGWLSTQDPDVEIRVDQTAHSGESSLRISSRAPVAWLRSKQFTVPQTGRMLFRIWARPEAGIAPRLRLLAESTTPSQAFARQVELAIPPDSDGQWRPYDLWINDLPTTVESLRVGVDVLGSGTVWLDDAQAFDLTFSRRERNELSKIIALADFQLREGRIGDCRTSLDQYWMQYIRSYVTADDTRVARAPIARPVPAVSLETSPSPDPKPNKDQNLLPKPTPNSGKVQQTTSDESQPSALPKTSSAFEKLRRFVPGFRR